MNYIGHVVRDSNFKWEHAMDYDYSYRHFMLADSAQYHWQETTHITLFDTRKEPGSTYYTKILYINARINSQVAALMIDEAIRDWETQ